MNTRPLRSREIRQANEKMILKIMHRTNPISQSEVAIQTGLQASTVFRIFRSLEQQNLIREVDMQRNGRERKGRKPAYYSVNAQIAYAVGADISSYGATLLVFDVFHHACLSSFEGRSPRWIIERAAATWSAEDGRPKIHYSDQWAGKQAGAHSESIDLKAFGRFYETIRDMDMDLMLEVKDKERSVLAVYDERPELAGEGAARP